MTLATGNFIGIDDAFENIDIDASVPSSYTVVCKTAEVEVMRFSKKIIFPRL
jgi:hypothetical protein